MKNLTLRLSVILLTILFFTIGFSNAQVLTGNIKGIVTTEDGTPLPGVTVEITSPVLLGGIHSQITSAKGNYRFTNLPPGLYKVVFILDGFNTIERLSLKVPVNGTITQNIVMTTKSIEETITVTGEVPIVDVTSSGMSTNLDKEFLEKMPIGRDSLLDVGNQAPGVLKVSSGSYDFMLAHGSNAEANIYQLDGLNITGTRLGDPLVRPNQDIFSEVEVSGIGAGAEYGNFTGMVVNIVTKSGGNSFSGALSYYGQFDAITADNNPEPDNYYSYTRHTFFDGTASLGGPIFKDKLWFFGSVNFTKNDETNWRSNPDYHSADNDINYFFKLSAQLSSAHKLVGVFSYRDWKFKDVLTPDRTEDALRDWWRDIPNWNIMYNWLLSRNAYLELKTSGYRDKRFRMPIYASLDDPTHYDLLTAVTSNAPWWPFEGRHTRFEANAKLSYFAEDFLGGNHEFKIGAQFNRGGHHQICDYSGGRHYYDYGGEPYLRYDHQPFYYGGQVDDTAVFIDDSWTLGDRLTLNLGLRYDHINASIPEEDKWVGWHKVDGEKTQRLDDYIVWDYVSPRIGFVFQLTSDKKTILKGHYGRYYENLSAGQFEWPGPFNTDTFMYFWNGEDWELFNYVPGDLAGKIDPNIEPAYCDQFGLGLEREIFSDFSIGLMGLYKDTKRSMAQWNVGGVYEQIPMVSPDNGETYLVYNQVGFENEYIVTNPEGFGQTYKAIIFSAKKRFSKKWMLNASLTLSRAEGINCTSNSNDYTQHTVIFHSAYFTGRDPNDYLNAKGLLQNDRSYMFKMQFAYEFPWSILTSVNFWALSGRPYVDRVRVYPDQGMRRIVAEPRNSDNRFDSEMMLDLRIQKTFWLTDKFRLAAMFDVFNVFNAATVLDYTNANVWSSVYKNPYSIPTPRRLQIGFKFEF